MSFSIVVVNEHHRAFKGNIRYGQGGLTNSEQRANTLVEIMIDIYAIGYFAPLCCANKGK